MKKIKLITNLALASVLLAACGTSTESKSPESDTATITAKQSDKSNRTDDSKKSNSEDSATDSLEKDASVFFNAVFTKSDSGFGKLYGDSYADWTDEVVFKDQVTEMVKSNGLEPEEDYSLITYDEREPITPTRLLTTFLSLRRDMMNDIKDYEIKDLSIDGDKAEVTISSRSINASAVADVTRQLFIAAYGDIDVLEDLNESNGQSFDLEKAKKVLTFHLFNLTYDGKLLGYTDVPVEYSYTPQTVKEYDKTVTFTKDKDGKWVVTAEAYRNFISSLMYEDKSYDVYYSETGEVVKDDGKKREEDSDALDIDNKGSNGINA